MSAFVIFFSLVSIGRFAPDVLLVWLSVKGYDPFTTLAITTIRGVQSFGPWLDLVAESPNLIKRPSNF